MKSIRDAVVKSIYRHVDNDERLISNLDEIAGTGGKIAYSTFFNVLTHLDLAPELAESYWTDILSHRNEMIRKLGRDVKLRTAICDYFCSVEKSLKNPVVVEIHVFEDQLNSLKYDSLTGLYTRSMFEETISRELSRAKRYETDLSLLFFDLDDFKRVNDTFGHLAGDCVLQEVSKTIKNQIRTEDSAVRFGGEEIVVILPQTGKVEALIMGERIREKIEAINFEYDGHTIQPTVSGGLAAYPIDAQNPTDLLKCADSALYRAKDFGKNNITVYSHDKRRYLRVHFFEKIHIRQIEFDNRFNELTASTKNISLAGVLFESETPMEIGTKVQLKIPLNNGSGPLQIIGTVVRVEIFDQNCYDIGVSFLEVDKAVKNEISRYMIHQLERVPV